MSCKKKREEYVTRLTVLSHVEFHKEFQKELSIIALAQHVFKNMSLKSDVSSIQVLSSCLTICSIMNY